MQECFKESKEKDTRKKSWKSYPQLSFAIAWFKAFKSIDNSNKSATKAQWEMAQLPIVSAWLNHNVDIAHLGYSPKLHSGLCNRI